MWTDRQNVVGFWFAIDDVTTVNGRLWVKPGGHRPPVGSRFGRTENDAPTMWTEVHDPAPYPVDDSVPAKADCRHAGPVAGHPAEPVP
ncbi:unannotated protein [freshwater metagenome]|uniref:Unannotated protein n=1 Tax=freshwater metagenome TaxID=449393 RepID=A0A6J7FNJ4_9ZZZZ